MSHSPLRFDNFHPTIANAYHAVEGYLECLAVSSSAEGATQPLALPPIDALLIRFAVFYQSMRPYVVDLAASHTWGVSTLLCRTDPSIRQVVSSWEDRPEKWHPILDRYLRDWAFPLVECIKVEGAHEALHRISDPKASILIIAAAEDALKQPPNAAFESWLELAPQAVIVLLGVEKTGVSSLLASLVVRCTDSPYRLALLRELAPALGESRLAVVSRRENVAGESMLVRIGHLFANQFQFLDLIKGVCDSALEQSVLNEPLSHLRAGVLEPNTLLTTYDLRRALVEREEEFQGQIRELRQELRDLRQSLTYRILEKVSRLSRFVRFGGTGQRVPHDDKSAPVKKQPTSTAIRRAS